MMDGLDLNTIISGGGFAVFTIFMAYIITKFLPNIIESFREEIKYQRELHERTITTLSDAIQNNGREIITALKELEETQKNLGNNLLKLDILEKLSKESRDRRDST